MLSFIDDGFDLRLREVTMIVNFCSDGFVTLQEYMQFMISRETENVQSRADIEEAFRTLSPDGNPYITKSEITQVSQTFLFNAIVVEFGSDQTPPMKSRPQIMHKLVCLSNTLELYDNFC